MVPEAGQAGAGQHSTNRPFHRAEDESGEHRGEYLISRCGETGPETLQQRRQGIGYTDLGGHWWNTPIHWRCCKHHQCSAPFLSLIHISEPTRRTPISYAVFCLKKKKRKNSL